MEVYNVVNVRKSQQIINRRICNSIRPCMNLWLHVRQGHNWSSISTFSTISSVYIVHFQNTHYQQSRPSRTCPWFQIWKFSKLINESPSVTYSLQNWISFKDKQILTYLTSTEKLDIISIKWLTFTNTVSL